LLGDTAAQLLLMLLLVVVLEPVQTGPRVAVAHRSQQRQLRRSC
jgi:hypothetical protein